MWFMWSDFVLKWSEVSYGEILGDKSTMCIRVTLHWGYLIVMWLFYLVCIMYCGCFNLFCNMWVCVCVGFVLRGCFGNVCTCIYCVLYCVYCVFVLFCLCTFILICFLCTNVRTTATEWKLNCSNNNNYYYYYYYYYNNTIWHLFKSVFMLGQMKTDSYSVQWRCF